MKIVFVSNYMNHHQLKVSQEFLKYSDYLFIATNPISEERKALGYKDMNKGYDFVLCSYDNQENYNLAIEKINEADIVIFGSCPFEMIRERIEDNKLTYRFSERLFKNHKILRKLSPSYVKKIKDQCTRYKDKNYYLLCASAYAEEDYNWFGAFKNKCFRWGYFPNIESFDQELENVVKKKNKSNTILWCGRIISFKHPEYVIYLAKYLKSKGIDFKIKMIGTGPLENKIKKMIAKNKLENCVSLTGVLPFDKVQAEMRKAKIFLFTSDQNEGWGAVLNESMGNACCVIANKKIGSVPFVIENKKNGYIYEKKDEFLKLCEHCCQSDQSEVCKEAYKTIHEVWNAENAVKSFIRENSNGKRRK